MTSYKTQLNKLKIEHGMRDAIYEKEWDTCIVTIDEISDNMKHIHQIMNEQMNVSNKTFSLLETIMTDLNDTKTQVEILSTFRDYIGIFFDEQVEQVLGKDEWDYVKSYFRKRRVLEVNDDERVKNSESILKDKYNITIDELELLSEMKKVSNETFHKKKENYDRTSKNEIERFFC